MAGRILKAKRVGISKISYYEIFKDKKYFNKIIGAIAIIDGIGFIFGVKEINSNTVGELSSGNTKGVEKLLSPNSKCLNKNGIHYHVG